MIPALLFAAALFLVLTTAGGFLILLTIARHDNEKDER